MIVVRFCYEIKLKLKKVSNKAKVNYIYYCIFKDEISALYGKDISHIESRITNPTVTFTSHLLIIRGVKISIKCVPFTKIPVKSSDASPWSVVHLKLLTNI